jgi:hypothetical protein
MAFLGSHDIDFSGSKKNIIDMIASRLSGFKIENLQFFIDYEQAFFADFEYLKTVPRKDRWEFSDFSFSGFLGITDKRKVIAAIGPYGLMLRISDTYMEFIAPIYNRTEWYSPDNTVTVTVWRNYFKQIITLMGGNEALYITQAYFDKYHPFFQDMNTTFSQKIETLTKKHGPINKPFTHYGNGKYPRYFLDNFTNL